MNFGASWGDVPNLLGYGHSRHRDGIHHKNNGSHNKKHVQFQMTTSPWTALRTYYFQAKTPAKWIVEKISDLQVAEIQKNDLGGNNNLEVKDH